jgi:phosphatidylglycerophosphatase A
MLTPKPHRTLRAAKTVLPCTDRLDHGDSLWDEYVAHWILDHLILFFILDWYRRFFPAILNRLVESTKYLSEQEVESCEKQNG